MKYDDWKEVTLGEISLDKKGSYGIGASAVEYSEDLYTYLRITDITDDGKLIKSDLKSVSDEKAEQYLLKPNDIVFARTGNSTGKSYFYDGSDGELVYAGFLIKFSLDPEKVNPRFIRFYTLSDEYKGWVKSFSTGSTRGNINAQTYANMRINLPPKNLQDLLVDILSKLEGKEKLNIEMINNLEQLSQTLFKQWFIDFEFPNEEGKPYKSSGGDMYESETGEIPAKWKSTKIGEAIKIVRGASPRPIQEYMAEEGRPWVKITDANASVSCFITETKEFIIDDGISKSRTVEPGTLILSNSATPGIPKFMDILASVHDGWLIFSEYQNVSKEFMYLYLIHEREPILSMSNGSVFRNLKTDILKNYKLVIPEETVLKKFQNIVVPIFDLIKNLANEIDDLKRIRDLLLRKFLSGEIKVPDESVVD